MLTSAIRVQCCCVRGPQYIGDIPRPSYISAAVGALTTHGGITSSLQLVPEFIFYPLAFSAVLLRARAWEHAY